MAAEVTRPERAVFNLHVPPARTAIDLAPALDDSLKPRVRGGAVVMEPVGSGRGSGTTSCPSARRGKAPDTTGPRGHSGSASFQPPAR
ncbi:MAG TPA: hypothetical protein VLL69_14680, partial [Streptosporangiaceae bacterium]|nr:hypothetical protein [Streptosporangiaceae bacterium]